MICENSLYIVFGIYFFIIMMVFKFILKNFDKNDKWTYITMGVILGFLFIFFKLFTEIFSWAC
jgi:hypothetical protein